MNVDAVHLEQHMRASNHNEKNTHTHFVIWAYEKKVPQDNGGFMYVNNVSIDVIADSYEEALKRAKQLCPLKHRYEAVQYAGYDLMNTFDRLNEGGCH